MSGIAIAWTVVSIVTAVFVGWGVGVMGIATPDYMQARVAFTLAAVTLGAMTLVWATRSGEPAWWRVLASMLVAVSVFVVYPEGLRWTYRLENKATQRMPTAQEIASEVARHIPPLPVSNPHTTATEIASEKATDHSSATVVTVADRRLCADANALATQLRDMEMRWLNEDNRRHEKSSNIFDRLSARTKADKKRTSDAAPLYRAATEVSGRLLSRLHDEQPTFVDEPVPLFLSERGSLRGAHPLMEAAHYLEQLARKLCG